jgi:hypothetical protein
VLGPPQEGLALDEVEVRGEADVRRRRMREGVTQPSDEAADPIFGIDLEAPGDGRPEVFVVGLGRVPPVDEGDDVLEAVVEVRDPQEGPGEGTPVFDADVPADVPLGLEVRVARDEAAQAVDLIEGRGLVAESERAAQFQRADGPVRQTQFRGNGVGVVRMVFPPEAGRQAEPLVRGLIVFPQVDGSGVAGVLSPRRLVDVPVAARLDRVSAAEQEAVAAGRVSRVGVEPEALVPEVAPVGAEEVDGGSVVGVVVVARTAIETQVQTGRPPGRPGGRPFQTGDVLPGPLELLGVQDVKAVAGPCVGK